MQEAVLARPFQTLTAVLLLLLLGACGSGAEPAAPGAISVDELAERLEPGAGPLVLDVRTREEFARGHIPGALNIPHGELADRLSELPIEPSEEVVVHCQSGRRAGLAQETLSAAGYSGARDLTGHWQQWQAAGHPTELP